MVELPVIEVTSSGGSPGRSPFSMETSASRQRRTEVSTPAYKHIEIDPSTMDMDQSPISWKPAVSFDSIPLVLNSCESEDLVGLDFEDEFQPPQEIDVKQAFLTPEVNERRNSRGRSTSPYRTRSPLRTRTPSPYLKVSNALDGFSQDGYPSTPTIDLDSFLYSKQTPGYSKYVKDYGKRVILCYITGRRHSWVALDYILAKLLTNGDHLVIVSRIPDDYRDLVFPHDDAYYECKYDKQRLLKGDADHSEEAKQKLKDRQEVFKRTIDDISKYVELVIPESKKSKIEFKLTIDIHLNSSTFNVLNDSVDIFQPVLICTTTKPNMRFSRRTTWKTSRISDRLVKNFEIPILIVPSLTLNQFEVELFEGLAQERNTTLLNQDFIKKKLIDLDRSFSATPSVSSFRSAQGTSNGLIKKQKLPDRDVSPLESGSISDTSSVESESGSDEDDEDEIPNSSPAEELAKRVEEHQEILASFVSENDKVDVNNDNKQVFLQKLNRITYESKKITSQFGSFADNDDSEGAELVRSLTGLTKIYKIKSMLDDFELPTANEPVSNKLRTTLSGAVDDKNRRLSSPPGASGAATSRAIKFSSDIGSPDRLKNRTKNGLTRYVTNVEDTYLAPSRSAERNKLQKSLSETKVPLNKDYENDKVNSGSNSKNVGKLKKKKKGFLRSLFTR